MGFFTYLSHTYHELSSFIQVEHTTANVTVCKANNDNLQSLTHSKKKFFTVTVTQFFADRSAITT